MQIDNLETILARRKEIEGEIVDMLKVTESDFTLDHVRDVIYHEEDNDDMIYPIGYDFIQRGEVVAMFDPSSRTQSVHYGAGRGGDASELTPLENSLSLTGLSNVLELVHPVR
ncbi:MAG: hypothetical protein A3J48_03540 [Candidatus Doudnabacteria bacterium RIFCSPHIGHO2_02_FULL_46_11]|uniref:Uncharacterized protein n=1 Tax=Candidatus Doudnabacteria bacterium RIFCSPHIGHO2_02_FULL_46_11 TaxID=1817832 RepID=A0A1F5P3Y7_9BACT|nr:MAG: hypothetical protein A3J48_03540 [Candidatus Doudnabacteria bacterium RIFCSPHIGHO2_02_FULL_46_11]